MPITSVVFDYGSVLAWPPSSESCARTAELAGIPRSLLLDRYYSERAAYDRDTIKAIEYWKRVTAGYPASTDRALLERLTEMDVTIWSEPNPSTVEWLPILKKAGLTLAILSNMPESFCEGLEKRDRWLDIFDFRIFSGRARLNKPEPAMYDLLLDTLAEKTGSRNPDEVLFLDDLEHNVSGACAMGINGELYNVFTGGLTEIAERYDLPLPPEITPPESRLNDFACAPHRHVK